jgi:hypothetical protein
MFMEEQDAAVLTDLAQESGMTSPLFSHSIRTTQPPSFSKIKGFELSNLHLQVP